ncbi:MAG: DNA methyltransferase [Ignavibacteriaceae bacterium]
MSYIDFIESKKKKFISSGFEIEENLLNINLFDFQRYIVKIALMKGRFAIFADTGLGKTLMQLSWADQVYKKTGKRVLIIAPLVVTQQTIREGLKFGINVDVITLDNKNLEITNYEQLKNIDIDKYGGVVLDESSILKGRDGKLSRLIIDSFKNTPYRLCCSATPSPNDHMELGQHSEFLGAMNYLEMLAMYFVHDGGETSKWRLRKHATDSFWKFVCTWSISIDNPRSLGFDGNLYDLPKLNYIEHIIPVDNQSGTLFTSVSVSATEIHRDLKRSFIDRIKKTVDLINNSDEQWIIWTLRNTEADELAKVINDSVNVQGSDKAQYKADRLNGFANKEFKVLITKTSIASMGMNFQNCFNQCFTSYDFKFEQFYQGVRRSYRFGQKQEVNVHLMIPESQINVRKTILEKQRKHIEQISQMSKYSNNTDYSPNKKDAIVMSNEIKNDDYHLINGDCVEKTKTLDDNCADIIVFSPPFADLYVYSDSPNDMGNVASYDEFEKHFKYLIPELKRVLKTGRICAIHCMDLPIQKGKEGFIGLRDFSGMLIKWFINEGFIYHARTTIWKNPVTEMQRTKALGLLHKTIKKDSVMSRVGIPDYVLFFRNGDGNETPIVHQDTDITKSNYLPVDLWQKYASPVWMDINYSRTLQFRSARDKNDEKHICTLQLDTIERILHLYSNEGDTVFSPFGGIGSEGCKALEMNRKSISIELKNSYFNLNAKNHRDILLKRDSVLKLF